LVDAVLDEDRQAVLGFYRTSGFTKAEVSAPEISPGAKEGSLVVTIRVSEGRRTFVEAADLEGIEPADRGGGARRISLAVGKPFNPQALVDDRQALTAYLHENGWTRASVESAADFSEDRGSVRVTYRVVEGDREYFGRLIVTGNTRTKTERLLRP